MGKASFKIIFQNFKKKKIITNKYLFNVKMFFLCSFSKIDGKCIGTAKFKVENRYHANINLIHCYLIHSPLFSF